MLKKNVIECLNKVADSLGFSRLKINPNMIKYSGRYFQESTANKKIINQVLNDKELSTYAFTYKDKLCYTLGPFIRVE